MESLSRRKLLKYSGISTLAFIRSVRSAGSRSETTRDQRNRVQFKANSTISTAIPQNDTRGNQTSGEDTDTPTTCEPASFERDEDGTISFERGAVEFESETERTELFRRGVPFIDLEISESTIDLSIETADESLEVDVTESSTDIEGDGSQASLEQENGEIEYVSESIDVEWSPTKLDIDRPVIIDYRNNEFEYRDETLAFEWKVGTQQFEYVCRR